MIDRVKNIVKYRKPVLVVMVAAGIGCIVLAVSLLSNLVGSRETERDNDVSLQENILQNDSTNAKDANVSDTFIENPEITESDGTGSTEQELYQTIYNIEGIAFFDNFAEGMEEYIGFRSERRIPFPRNDANSEDMPSPVPIVDYGYLNSDDGTIGNLNYVVSDMVFMLFPEDIF